MIAAAVTVFVIGIAGSVLLESILPLAWQSKAIGYGVAGISLGIAVSAFHFTRQFVTGHPVTKRYFAAVAALACFVLLVFGATMFYPKWQLHQTMVAAQAAFQKQLPQKIDSDMLLVAVKVGFTDWTYVYDLTGQIPTPENLRASENTTRRSVCASNMKSRLREGASYVYQYREAGSDRLVYQFEIASCP